MIDSTLKVQSVPIGQIKPYKHNPRKVAKAVAKVAASLKEFGWRQPIVTNVALEVIVGHVRLLAAQQLGCRTVPVHIATGLTPTQIRAYRLADNRVAEEAAWDDELLVRELLDLKALDFELGVSGFDAEEIASLLAPPAFTPSGPDQQGKLDEIHPITCPQCGHQWRP